MKPEERVIVAVPFVQDDDYGEEPDESEDGSVPMVQFEFTDDDYQILGDLQVKQTEKAFSNSMDLGQMYLEKKISDLLADILGDYMMNIGGYRLKPVFKQRAQELLAFDGANI